MHTAQITVLLTGFAIGVVTPGAVAQDAQDVKPDERSPVQRNRRAAPGDGQGDGRVNSADVVAYLNAFANGCGQ